MTLGTYEYGPHIRCGSAEIFTDAPSCGALLAEMPASRSKAVFGPEGSPGVVEPLPQLLASGKQPRWNPGDCAQGHTFVSLPTRVWLT